jgi:hypothetical protein
MEGTHRALFAPLSPLPLLAGLLLLADLLIAAPDRKAAAQDLEVDLELVLAVDVSRSMDLKEQELQRNGYAQAISHPDVIAAIQGGLLQRIAVTYVEWAGPGRERVIVPWRLIDSEESAQGMTTALSSASLSSWSGTSITAALTFSSFLFHDNGYEGLRRVIDISGDGPNNAGGLVTIARDQVIAEGITINGLPILAGTPGAYGIAYLDAYYEACVIGGPGAFMVTVFDMETFAVAIRQKLILEIAGRTPWKQVAQAPGEVPDVIDCAIGEKIRMRWEDH